MILEMTASTCWSPWQKMPTRYQLTAKSIEDEDIYPEERCKSPRVKSPRRVKTPKPNRGCAHRYIPEAEIPTPSIAGCNPSSCHTPTNNRRLNFPNRKSGYIDHYKTQQRVISARVKFSTEPPQAPYYPKDRERATTAPAFPVTSSSNLNDGVRKSSESLTQCGHQTQNICPHHLQEHTGSSIISGKNENESQTCIEFDDKISLISSHQSSKTQRKFNIQETADGTLYIDNGKVVFFKKSRNNPAVLLKSRLSDGSFLASIRREYLSQSKCIAMSQASVTPTEERLVQRERVYYNQKVGHILDYYCTDDEDRLSIDDINKLTRGTPKGNNSRLKSPRNSKVRRIYFDPNAKTKDGPASNHMIHGWNSPVTGDEIEDPNFNSYMKVNKKLKLHDRKFYLRTPHSTADVKPGITQYDIDNCKCGICRIEMQLSLMAQLGITKNAHVQTVEDFIRENRNDKPQKEPTNEKIVRPRLPSKTEETQSIKTQSIKSSKTEVRPTDADEVKSEPSTTNVTNPESTTIEVTVPGMGRETSDLTQVDSALNTARTAQSPS